ncbi:helix-turn-helix domain-containing protein [Micromonospora sp. NBC_01699]|uniref:helix-turn-helix domain-containing protein n=1 Tax=Micromonospora sp. NBC_01699 TaxID=2975984 RepID=UPI002E30CBA2|nr:helix-turn-helix transcriptional regulator [Micromonospora sp. NBC_01699]
MDEMSVSLTLGERVAWYRRRRGPSQEVVAGLAGRTADWLGKVENNRIELDRLSVIKTLADVLDIAPGDLLAEPSLIKRTMYGDTQTGSALPVRAADREQ